MSSKVDVTLFGHISAQISTLVLDMSFWLRLVFWDFTFVLLYCRYRVAEDKEQLKTYHTVYSLLTLKSTVLGLTMFDVYWCRLPGFGDNYTAKVVVKGRV